DDRPRVDRPIVGERRRGSVVAEADSSSAAQHGVVADRGVETSVDQQALTAIRYRVSGDDPVPRAAGVEAAGAATALAAEDKDAKHAIDHRVVGDLEVLGSHAEDLRPAPAAFEAAVGDAEVREGRRAEKRAVVGRISPGGEGQRALEVL